MSKVTELNGLWCKLVSVCHMKKKLDSYKQKELISRLCPDVVPHSLCLYLPLFHILFKKLIGVFIIATYTGRQNHLEMSTKTACMEAKKKKKQPWLFIPPPPNRGNILAELIRLISRM